MDGFDPVTSFVGKTAERYDDDVRGDEDETVDFLAGLAGLARRSSSRPTWWRSFVPSPEVPTCR